MPLGAYYSSFTVGGTPAGFDIRTYSYGADVEGNRTVTVIPWAQTYSLVVQRGGIKPLTRSYRVIFYLEADYVHMATYVNKPGGVLTTPREGSVSANLDKISRGDSVDGTNIDGMATAVLSFTILQ